MTRLIHGVRSFWRDEQGQDLLEYALLIALIALVSVLAVTAAGKKVETIFNAIAAAIPAA
jgi:pilus assembly protein Flp/PilA